MVQQVTKGIKISVKTGFEGAFTKGLQEQYAFNYEVTIENQSNDSIQLTDRHWTILDSLKSQEIVSGEGVIGKKPVLKPGESHTYNSGCVLSSPFGSMKGYYSMINFSTTKRFNVDIPNFKLCATFALN